MLDKTCANCGDVRCHEVRQKLGLKQENNVEHICGFAWQHICAHWTPLPKVQMDDD